MLPNWGISWVSSPIFFYVNELDTHIRKYMSQDVAVYCISKTWFVILRSCAVFVFSVAFF